MDEACATTSAAATLNGDRPKERISEDRLGYAGFARAVAQSITRVPSADGMVMAIHGQWGSGKTSAVNMVVDALGSTPAGQTVLVVRFNPWWFSEQEDLTRAFFAEVSATLGTQVSDDVRSGLKKVAKRLSSARKLIGVGVGAIPVLASFKDLIEGGLETLGDIADGDASLDEVRNDLREALKREAKRILVIIDDVDRLPADEARQIFRLVKSVADLPNVLYLLVFDREIARRVLEGPSSTAGPEWLEKIVQASFDIPPARFSDLAKLFTDGLDEIVGPGVHVDEVRWPNIFHRAVGPWLRTPRDVARLLNAISVSWPVVAQEVDLADFVALETLRTFEPTAYDQVRRNEHRLAGTASDSSPVEKGWYDDLVLAVSEPRRSGVKEALIELFPRLAGVWGNLFYQSDHVADWDKAKRACAPRRFPAYFTYAIGPDVFSQADLDNIIALLGSPAEFRARVEALRGEVRLSGDTRAGIIADELQIDPERAGDPAQAAKTLLEMADAFLSGTEDNDFGTSVPMQWRLDWMIESQLRRLAPDERLQILKAAVESSPSLQAVGSVVDDVVNEHDAEARRPVAEADRLLAAEPMEVVKNAWAERLASEAAGGTLLSSQGLIRTLYRWTRVASEAEVRAWTDIQLVDDKSALHLAEVVTGTATIQGGNDIGIRRIPTVNRNSVAHILDIDRLESRIAEIKALEGLDENSKTVIDRFQRGLADRQRY